MHKYTYTLTLKYISSAPCSFTRRVMVSEAAASPPCCCSADASISTAKADRY